MKDERCPACGGRNAADTEFCVLCGTYLGWEDKRPTGPRMRGRGANPDTQLSVHLEQQEAVVVTPGAPPSPVTVHLTNLSTAVEAYRVAAVHAPPWLIVTPGQARLLPGTEARVQLTLAIDAKNRIPVRRFRLQVRVQGESSQALWREVGLDVVVGSVANPVQLRREPNQLRARDTAATVGSAQSTCAVVLDPPVTMQLDPMVVHAGRRTAQTHVILDNRRGTRPQRVHLAARAPEESLRFSFVPQNLEVPAGSYATARLSMQAARPGPGESSTRTVIVSAGMVRKPPRRSVNWFRTLPSAGRCCGH